MRIDLITDFSFVSQVLYLGLSGGNLQTLTVLFKLSESQADCPHEQQ